MLDVCCKRKRTMKVIALMLMTSDVWKVSAFLPLSYAGTDAKMEGMEFCVKQARTCARKANALKSGTFNDEFSKRINTIQKKLGDEHDFLLRTIDRQLTRANEYAEDGDKEMIMESYISLAKKCAQKVNDLKSSTLHDNFQHRVDIIRKSLSSEHDFFSSEMEHHLTDASKHAKDGDKERMELCIEEAKKCAQKANVLDDKLQHRVDIIRKNLSSEHDFFSNEMERHLTDASTYANNGDKEKMELSIEEAKKQASALSEKFQHKVDAIRKNLNSERDFFSNEMDHHLTDASKHADDGSKEKMEFCIEEAKKCAQKASVFDDEFQHKANAIRKNKSSEHDFFSREMERHLTDASTYANYGKRWNSTSRK